MAWDSGRRGAVEGAANRDGSRAGAELEAAAFTVFMAGRMEGLSVLAHACPSRWVHSNPEKG
jgi:hypothetical protein